MHRIRDRNAVVLITYHNQCLSPLTLCGVLATTLWDKVCRRLARGLDFFLDTPLSSTNKTDRHDIAEILLKVALSIIKTNIYDINNNNYNNNNNNITQEKKVTSTGSICTWIGFSATLVTVLMQ